MFYFAWFSPLAWVFIIPPILLAQDSAEKWVWDSVPKEGRRRWRRMQADKRREKMTPTRVDHAPSKVIINPKPLRSENAAQDLPYQWIGRSSHTTIKP